MTLSNAEAAKRAGPAQPVLRGVNALAKSLGDLDAAGEAKASIARALARKMDLPGTGATSLALLSRELRAVLESLIDPTRDAKAQSLIAEVFGQ